MAHILVDFGKYRNQPAEKMLRDKSYCSWFVSNFVPRTDVQLKLKDLIENSLSSVSDVDKTGNLTTITRQLSECKDIASLRPVTNLSWVERDFTPIEMIKRLHEISAKDTGIFVDYLVRRLIWEMNGCWEGFEDARAETVLFDTKFRILTKRLVDRERYLPRYRAYVNPNVATRDCVTDILETSQLHSIFFGDKMESLSEVQNLIESTDLSWIDELKFALQPFCCGRQIHLNPILSINSINADADLIVGKHLYDFKVSKYPPDLKDKLQILGYSSLVSMRIESGDDDFQPINRASIMNLYLGKIWSISLSSWTLESRLAFFT